MHDVGRHRATIAVAILFGAGKYGTSQLPRFKACTRHVRYTPIADVSPRRSEPPLRALGDVVGEVIHRHASPQREVWRATNLVVSLLGLPSANHRGNVHDPKEFYIYPPLTTRVPDDRAEASRHVPSIRARVH